MPLLVSYLWWRGPKLREETVARKIVALFATTIGGGLSRVFGHASNV